VALALHLRTRVRHLLLNRDLGLNLGLLLLHELSRSHVLNVRVCCVRWLACEKFMLALYLAVFVLFRRRALGLCELDLKWLDAVVGNLDVLSCTFTRLELLRLLLDLGCLCLEQLLLIVLTLA
jgi:hypothetical protein